MTSAHPTPGFAIAACGGCELVRLRLQNEINLLLAIDDSSEVVMPAVLELLCEALGWRWGALWRVDETAARLRLHAIWHEPSSPYREMEEASRSVTFAEGNGFPGMAWARRNVLWERHFGSAGYTRSAAAEANGLNSALAIPIRLGSQVLAVLELLTATADTPDEALSSTLKAVGYAIARHMERGKARSELARSEQRYRLMFESHPAPLWIADRESGRFLAVNEEALRTYGYSKAEFDELTEAALVAGGDAAMEWSTEQIRDGEERRSGAGRHCRKDGEVLDVEIVAHALEWDSRPAWLVLARDVTKRCRVERERESMELQLRSAQRLESIGQLAAGIAHEINTPTQYVGDNVRFLKEVCSDVTGLLERYQELVGMLERGEPVAAQMQSIRDLRDRLDWEYLREDIPQAFEQTLAGIQQVAKIVGSMKEFSHPGQHGKTPVDLNRAIANTITVSRNEWKYVADVEADLDPTLPQVVCMGGEISQVVLNLIVNAAHAIQDANVARGRDKGLILVRTRHFPNSVEIQVQDDGNGIPSQIRERVFDPFFTTKEVGRGTGQGLAIARSVIADKHGGNLCFESEEGRGTTFFIQLPLDSAPLLSSVLDVTAPKEAVL